MGHYYKLKSYTCGYLRLSWMNTLVITVIFLYLTWVQHWAPTINLHRTSRFRYFCDPQQLISCIWRIYDWLIINQLFSLNCWFWASDGFSCFWHCNWGWLRRDPRTLNRWLNRWLTDSLTINPCLEFISIFNLCDFDIFLLPPRYWTVTI